MSALDVASIDFIRDHPLLGMLNATDRSRLISSFQLRQLSEGESLFLEGEKCDQVCFMRSGVLEVFNAQNSCQIEQGTLGLELLLGAVHSEFGVRALSSATVLTLQVAALADIVNGEPKIRSWFYDQFRLLSNLIRHIDTSPLVAKDAQQAQEWKQAPDNVSFDSSIRRLIGWMLSLGLPLLTLYMGSFYATLDKSAVYFLAIMSATVSMWIFDLMPAFVPPLFSLLAVVVLDVVPYQVALAGFASDGFFMLLSVFAIGAVLVISGLSYRLSLMILRLAPSDTWSNISVLLYGLLLTPIIPSQLGRGVIISPFLGSLVGVVGAAKIKKSLPKFYASALGGVALFASIFLTGKPANLIIFSLFDFQTQFEYGWGHWLVAASFTALLLLVFFLVGQWIFFKHSESFVLPKNVLKAQLEILGPMTTKEWGALLAILFFIVGILTLPFHSLELAWIALFILVCLFIFDIIERADLNTRVDWTTLIFIGSIVTWAPIIRYTGMDVVISSLLEPIGVMMKSNFYLFSTLLAVAIVLIRFVLPELVTEILLFTMLLPLAMREGISPWVVGFIILTVAEGYVFKYQAPYFLQFDNQLTSQGVTLGKDEKHLLMFNAYMSLARVAVIIISLQFWKFMDII